MPGLFQPNIFQNPLVFQVTAPATFAGTYRALTDLYLPDGTYIEAGITFLGPPNWIPSVGVDPIDSNAIQAYWNLGPVMMRDAEIGRCLFPWGSWMRRTGEPVFPPIVFWKPVPGGFILTGGGAALGPKSL